VALPALPEESNGPNLVEDPRERVNRPEDQRVNRVSVNPVNPWTGVKRLNPGPRAVGQPPGHAAERKPLTGSVSARRLN
jgi:hypothetical protein